MLQSAENMQSKLAACTVPEGVDYETSELVERAHFSLLPSGRIVSEFTMNIAVRICVWIGDGNDLDRRPFAQRYDEQALRDIFATQFLSG